ncbi:hypothetical protein B0G73_10114 [Paraburkholderia sp. BL25I1N1]|nr:hypothetical protein B0G73_10114 [Paraburkholderia sp. BL25I1N1]
MDQTWNQAHGALPQSVESAAKANFSSRRPRQRHNGAVANNTKPPGSFRPDDDRQPDDPFLLGRKSSSDARKARRGDHAHTYHCSAWILMVARYEMIGAVLGGLRHGSLKFAELLGPHIVVADEQLEAILDVAATQYALPDAIVLDVPNAEPARMRVVTRWASDRQVEVVFNARQRPC